MNSYSIPFFESVLATPLEQFQILPLSAQVYPSVATLTSLEEANLFPQLAEGTYVYATSSFAGSALTSWGHHAWFDLYSAVPSYLFSTTAASTSNAVAWGALEAGFANPQSLSIQWYDFTSFLTLPVAYVIYMVASAGLWAYFYALSSLGVVTSLLTTVVCLPFIAIGMALNFLPGQGAGELVEPLTVIASTSSNAFAYGTSLFLTQFSDFIQGLFAGQILVGPLFTNFMLVTVLGLVALKLFLSLSLYETKLVPTRWQSIYEVLYGFILQTVCEAIGEKRGEKFFPAFLTLFFLVLSANVIALFPYTYSITAQLIVTFTISFFAFAVINLIGFLHNGVYLFGQWLPKGCPLAIVPFIIVIETISYVFRPISLALRIFANILSGHCMLKIVTIFVWFVFAVGGIGFLVHGISLGLVVMINILEVGVAAIQSYVFTILCCVYTNDALEAGH
jgi:ATP synthase subunit 6